MIYYAIIILISTIVFSRQERKHRFERSLFYTYEQLQQRIVIPVRDMLDSLLIAFTGAILIEINVLYVVLTRVLIKTINHKIKTNPQAFFDENIMQITIAIFIGGGIALLFLGIRSVIANIRYKKLQ